MINIITICLACWLWSDDPPKPAPKFNYELIYRLDLTGNRFVRICCLDNTQQRPIYIFKFINFQPYAKIKFPALDYFTYDSDTAEVDYSGSATILAFPSDCKTVPKYLDFNVMSSSIYSDEDIHVICIEY